MSLKYPINMMIFRHERHFWCSRGEK